MVIQTRHFTDQRLSRAAWGIGRILTHLHITQRLHPLIQRTLARVDAAGVAAEVEASTRITAAELMPEFNASEAAKSTRPAACLLPKILAQRLRSARRPF
ncbi:hypothetical protein [Yersinia ruckeri]|uniref:hypothetical protein n=1 Tax=Yersinia ruckeri TaxID=29486 RepID=UPI001F2D56C9|nr:hypothetical protein [Yersinia ruckeri]UIM89672.1 hypothetical protein LGL87_10120 [Yersinia ruckeri]